MNRNIVYCLYSYLPEDEPYMRSLQPLIRDMEIWAKSRSADFKLITKIPDVVEDVFTSITKEYRQRDTLQNLGRIIAKNKNKSKIHKYKAWNTKFNIIHEFYKSDYEKMLYLDCDIFPRAKKSFEFKEYNNHFYLIRRTCLPEYNAPMKLIPEKYLKKSINHRFLAGIILLTKNYKHNLAKLFSYENIYNLWLLDDMCIREETAINYIIHRDNMSPDIMKQDKNGNKIFRFVHIGGNKQKIQFTYQDQWIQ